MISHSAKPGIESETVQAAANTHRIYGVFFCFFFAVYCKNSVIIVTIGIAVIIIIY